MIPYQNSSKYWFSKLDDDEKQMYTDICDALLRYEKKLHIGRALAAAVEKVINAVFFDNPVFFYPDDKKTVFAQSLSGTVLMFSYNYSAFKAEQISEALSRKLDSFEKTYITKNMKPLAKQIEIHRYLQQNVKTAVNSNNKECHSVVGALIDGSCVCEGFAKAYKLICDKIRLPSLIVKGSAVNPYGVREPHAWNITRINNITAHIDVTWDAVYGTGSYDYFNLTDDEISVDHFFDRGFYPACTDNSLGYFSMNKLIADNMNELKQIICANSDKPFFSVKLRFACDKDTLAVCGFPKGELRLNEARNIVLYRKNV